MGYLIDRSTLIHVPAEPDGFYDPMTHIYVPLNEDGFIPYEGKVKPINGLVDVKFRSGIVSAGFPEKAFLWSSPEFSEDVVGYRPSHVKTEAEEIISKATPISKAPPVATISKAPLIEGLLGQLDRAHQAASQIPDLIDLLRKHVDGYGYMLMPKTPFVGVLSEAPESLAADLSEDQPLDFTNPKNWKVGDLLECVNSDLALMRSLTITVGDIYVIRGSGVIGSYVRTSTNNPDMDAEYFVSRFRFFRRPKASV